MRSLGAPARSRQAVGGLAACRLAACACRGPCQLTEIQEAASGFVGSLTVHRPNLAASKAAKALCFSHEFELLVSSSVRALQIADCLAVLRLVSPRSMCARSHEADGLVMPGQTTLAQRVTLKRCVILPFDSVASDRRPHCTTSRGLGCNNLGSSVQLQIYSASALLHPVECCTSGLSHIYIKQEYFAVKLASLVTDPCRRHSPAALSLDYTPAPGRHVPETTHRQRWGRFRSSSDHVANS